MTVLETECLQNKMAQIKNIFSPFLVIYSDIYK